MNARFQHYTNDSCVVITLQPGQMFTHHHFNRDEEGYSAETHEWEHDGQGVIERFHSEGRDCDGRVSRSVELYCPLEKLRARSVTDMPADNGIGWPEWDRSSESQRDYSAEAAGY